MFYYEAIHVVGAERASQYMNLMPVFAVILASIFLGEHITVSLILGGGLVVLGLYVTSIKIEKGGERNDSTCLINCNVDHV